VYYGLAATLLVSLVVGCGHVFDERPFHNRIGDLEREFTDPFRFPF
jgi:hypothetical protein